MARVLAVDVGSTFTKAVLVDPDQGSLLGRAETPTTWRTDVMDGIAAVRETLAAGGAGARPGPLDEVLVCSSAGGGLRLAVVGYERGVTAEAGARVGLSAGAKVVHVQAGPISAADLSSLRASSPDIVLLVGGTDGGNAEVLLHNARRLARARVRQPVVVAGNSVAADEVSAVLASTGRAFVRAPNVLPEIGVLAPDGARRAIRAVFLRHVIGGKGLSKGPAFARLVRAATPDAMLAGVESLADAAGGDVLVVDVGGATTDVYSVVAPEGEDAALRKDVVPPLWHARTVEGDLGVRWNAPGVLGAARAEQLLDAAEDRGLEAYAARLARQPEHLPAGPQEQQWDVLLARLAAVVAVRRHARPAGPGASPRPMAAVTHVVGSGGVLRHAASTVRDGVVGAITRDAAGGWRLPRSARTGVDSAYVLFAAGLLRAGDPDGATRVARLALSAAKTEG